jgi:hypothetical protein
MLAATTPAETGSNRTCTSAGAADPEYPGKDGCLFGAPLPIPNRDTPAASTCVVNRVTTSASGAGSFANGSLSSLSVPLGADIYLTGDIDLNLANGIQPCPTCVARPIGDGCTTGTCCVGGPNDNRDCVPGSSALGPAYPTSHDCPPPQGIEFVSTLPISFALTTGTASKVSLDLAGQRVFCGFCAKAFDVSFQTPPTPCTSDPGCTDPMFPRCKQRDSGAFGIADARTVTETGTEAGAIDDGLPHAATLVSVFCVPPSYNPTVDGQASLPGPGAVALPGAVQALP